MIYIGTFSKVLFPALRLGYLVVPPDLVARFAAVREAMDIFPPTLYQAALADFIDEGHFGRHLRRMRQLYRERRSALVDGAADGSSAELEVPATQAGMHLTATLPRGFSRPPDLRGAAAGALGDAALLLLPGEGIKARAGAGVRGGGGGGDRGGGG